MLVSLLPGLRDLRTPLAAGYVWLLAAWVAFEPWIPLRPEDDTVLESAYRAGRAVSIAALGVALSFAAYLVGTLSTSLLSGPLRRLAGGDSLNPQSQSALRQVARAGREQLVLALSLSGTDVDRFFQEQFASPEDSKNRSDWLRWVRLHLFPVPEEDQRATQVFLTADTPGVSSPVDPHDVERERLLAAAIGRDLNVIATTRLLGRDQELYIVVDKNRAEADFRLGVVPPLLALAAAISARSLGLVAAVVLAVGVLMSWALIVQALRSGRDANEILLDSIVDGRVPAPSLDRAQRRAAAIIGRTPKQAMTAAAATMAQRLDAVLEALSHAYRSEPAQARKAADMLPGAHEALTNLKEHLPGQPSKLAQEAVDMLDTIADEWVRRMDGQEATPGFDPDAQRTIAQARVDRFRIAAGRALNEVMAVNDRPASPSGAGDPTPDDHSR
jgi:hypothetical protein